MRRKKRKLIEPEEVIVREIAQSLAISNAQALDNIIECSFFRTHKQIIGKTKLTGICKATGIKK